VGEKNRKGNNNLRVYYQSDTENFAFSILVDGGAKGERLAAPLYVSAPFKAIFKQHAQGVRAYTVKVLIPPTGEHFRVLITFDHASTTIPNGQGIAGLDINPPGLL
jgi:hypothetical protein